VTGHYPVIKHGPGGTLLARVLLVPGRIGGAGSIAAFDSDGLLRDQVLNGSFDQGRREGAAQRVHLVVVAI